MTGGPNPERSIARRSVTRTVAVHATCCLMLVVVSSLGCTDPNATAVTDLHEDFEHSNHEQEHAGGFHGSHTHEQRDVDPLFGGQLFPIGHTHNNDGATYFHAEVMPLEDNAVRFHVLTDSGDGDLEVCPIEAHELGALISVKGNESLSSECSITAVDNSLPASEFSLVIPEAIADADSYSVVVPKIEVGGHRQNFGFHVRRAGSDQNSALAESKDSHE